MDNELEFSTQAFSKMVMHAMKYPHSTCSGLLLSPKPRSPRNSKSVGSAGDNGDDGDDANNDNQQQDDIDDKVTKIIEAIPISHASHIGNAPIIEIAFNSVSVFAQEQELVICGYYQTDRNISSPEPDIFSQKVTDKICESYPNAVLCFISFESGLPQSLLDPHQLIDGKWRRKAPNTCSIESDPDVIADNILYSKEKLYRKIVDFDDHFNNITLDWTNAKISQKIDYLIANVC